MAERSAAPDNSAAVELREAQRPPSLGARTPQAATPGNRAIAVGARRADRKAPPKGAVAQRPGASRRSIPSLEGKKEKRDTSGPGARNQRIRAAQRWLFVIPGRRKAANPESITTNNAIMDRQGLWIPALA